MKTLNPAPKGHQIALAAIVLASAIGIMPLLDLHCRPGDVTTTNGRELCKASVSNTSAHNYQGVKR